MADKYVRPNYNLLNSNPETLKDPKVIDFGDFIDDEDFYEDEQQPAIP
jgi:hypothetical protein